jgi:predicted 3-demethylubiquinone-9 3-methyltransferase (glyoxalase superfamily)
MYVSNKELIMATTPNITPFLWFNDNAEEAMNFYASIFPHAKITNISRLPENTPGEMGKAIMGSFELEGQAFNVLNGGPGHPFTDAISLFVSVETQEEVDNYWAKLAADGGTEGQCGWLKDKFGLSWQIVPTALGRLLGDPNPAKSQQVMAALLKMGKIEIAELEKAATD